MKPPLDAYTSQYKPGAVTEIENDLVLNWYPNRILRRIGAQHGQSLLELGLGHGFTALKFHEHFTHHTVIEGSSEVITLFRASRVLPSLKIVEDYFENFTSTEQFDVIVMGFILEHVDDPALIVRRYRQMLAPGGRLFIAVPNAKSLNRRLGVTLGKIANLYELNANDHLLGHQRQFCLDTLKAMMTDSGFIVSWVEGIYLKPLPLPVLRTLPDFEANLRAMCEVGVDFPELCVALLVEAVPTT